MVADLAARALGRRGNGCKLYIKAFWETRAWLLPSVMMGRSLSRWCWSLTSPQWSQGKGHQSFCESLKWVDLRPGLSLPFSREKERFSFWLSYCPALGERCPAFPLWTLSCLENYIVSSTYNADWLCSFALSDLGHCYFVSGTQASSRGAVDVRYPTVPPKHLRLGLRTKETRLQSTAWVEGWSSQLRTISSIFSLAQSLHGERLWMRQVPPGTVSREVDVVGPVFSVFSQQTLCLPCKKSLLWFISWGLGLHDFFLQLIEWHRSPIYFVYIES